MKVVRKINNNVIASNSEELDFWDYPEALHAVWFLW